MKRRRGTALMFIYVYVHTVPPPTVNRDNSTYILYICKAFMLTGSQQLRVSLKYRLSLSLSLISTDMYGTYVLTLHCTVQSSNSIMKSNRTPYTVQTRCTKDVFCSRHTVCTMREISDTGSSISIGWLYIEGGQWHL
jgi:hypothetical protein